MLWHSAAACISATRRTQGKTHGWLLPHYWRRGYCPFLEIAHWIGWRYKRPKLHKEAKCRHPGIFKGGGE